MKVVLLCGGLGTRLREETEFRPKPMVEIGGRPILWHIMKLYAHAGFREFVCCLGYRGNLIKEYFLNYEAMNNDSTVRLGRQHTITHHGAHAEQDFTVTLVETGAESMTGGRIKRTEPYVDGDTFMVTYGDGLSNVDMRTLVEFHVAHGKLATVTTVRPFSRFGILALDERGMVIDFAEKPQIDGWASAGFFVFNRDVFSYLGGDECILEREPLERLAREGQLVAYQHDGFFHAMDTYRDYQYLRDVWASGKAPWKIWGVSDPFWRDRPTLVTGATGLLGNSLVRRLAGAGADVVCLVRDWVPQSELVRSELIDTVRVVRGDIRDRGVVERAVGEYEIDSVFHLAAQTIVGIANRDPVSTFESNIQGTWVVLEACRRSPLVKQVVLASSDKAYGAHDTLPYDEDTALDARHPYDVSKSCADLIAQTYAASFGVRAAITRCGNFYGPGDLNWNRLVPGTIRSVLRGQRPVIRSNGQYIRDYLYVEDAAAAYMLLAEKIAGDPELGGQAFNFSNEMPLTVLDLVRKILSLMQSPLQPDVRDEASNEIPEQYLSTAKARRVLGWKPLYGFEEALQATIAWYRDYFAHE